MFKLFLTNNHFIDLTKISDFFLHHHLIPQIITVTICEHDHCMQFFHSILLVRPMGA